MQYDTLPEKKSTLMQKREKTTYLQQLKPLGVTTGSLFSQGPSKKQQKTSMDNSESKSTSLFGAPPNMFEGRHEASPPPEEGEEEGISPDERALMQSIQALRAKSGDQSFMRSGSKTFVRRAAVANNSSSSLSAETPVDSISGPSKAERRIEDVMSVWQAYKQRKNDPEAGSCSSSAQQQQQPLGGQAAGSRAKAQLGNFSKMPEEVVAEEDRNPFYYAPESRSEGGGAGANGFVIPEKPDFSNQNPFDDPMGPDFNEINKRLVEKLSSHHADFLREIMDTEADDSAQTLDWRELYGTKNYSQSDMALYERSNNLLQNPLAIALILLQAKELGTVARRERTFTETVTERLALLKGLL